MQRNALKFRIGTLASDAAVITLALLVAAGWRRGFSGVHARLTSLYFPIVVSSVAAWTIVSVRIERTRFRLGWSWSKICSEVAVGVFAVLVVDAATAYLTRDYVPRVLLLYFAALLLPGLLAVRAISHPGVWSRWRKPNRRIVIIGGGRVAREVAKKLAHHREMLCEVVGFLYPSFLEAETSFNPGLQGISISPLDAITILREKKISDVIVVFSGQPMPDGLLDLVAHCRNAAIRVSVVPHLYELYRSRASLLDLDGVPIVSLRDAEPGWHQIAAKRAFDVAATIVISPLCLIVLGVSCLYLRLRHGRALSTEIRCGKQGREFRLYRLAVEASGTRLSAVERVMDSFGIAELPQLWNVLRGDMSLVGPRPERLDRVKHYSEWQKQRLAVLPGLTGLAQVQGLRDHNSSEEKTNFDLQYIASWSLSSDLVLLVQTLWTLFSRSGDCFVKRSRKPSGPITLGSGYFHADRANSSAN
jgi:lipopolysaccharide/colanic/teichoic acid biosynthesis glycosyltransferase